MNVEERVRMPEVLARFANSFDVKDWSGLEACFTESLYTDHTPGRAAMVVWRKSDEKEFTSHCVYEFQLNRQESDWKTSGIAQKVLWNEGTKS